MKTNISRTIVFFIGRAWLPGLLMIACTPIIFIAFPLYLYTVKEIISEYPSLNQLVDGIDETNSRNLTEKKISDLEKIVKQIKNPSQRTQLNKSINEINELVKVLPVSSVDEKIAYKDVLSLRKDQVTILNSFLLTILQTVGSLFFVVTAVISYRNFQSSNQKQISERLSQVFTNLASDDESVNLTGIYLFERLAQDSLINEEIMIESLAGFIRNKFPRDRLERNNYLLQKAINLIKDIRDRRPDLRKLKLDLSETQLQEIRLESAHLENVNFKEAILTDSYFQKAYLNGANLRRADLSRATLNDANLSSGLDAIDVTDLREAIFTGAGLTRVVLRGAKVQNAVFTEAILAKTDFRDCTDLSQQQLNSANNSGSEAIHDDLD